MTTETEGLGAEENARRSSVLAEIETNRGDWRVEWNAAAQCYAIVFPDGYRICVSYFRRVDGQYRESDMEHALNVAAALERIYTTLPMGADHGDDLGAVSR